MPTDEHDGLRDVALDDAWWELASSEQREMYQQTESDSRRHSLRLDMRFAVCQRLASGEYEAWGHWICGNAPPQFQKIDANMFRTVQLIEGQNTIEFGQGKYDFVVIRKSANNAPDDSRPALKEAVRSEHASSAQGSKPVPPRAMKRGAKPKYKYTKTVFDDWHREDSEALKRPASSIYPEYQRRFRTLHTDLAPVGERSLHKFLKRWRAEKNIEVD